MNKNIKKQSKELSLQYSDITGIEIGVPQGFLKRKFKFKNILEVYEWKGTFL